jgi:hypothetical protein
MKFQRLHPDSSLSKASLAYWRSRTTEQIVASLKPGGRIALKVKGDGIIMDGNTRMKVLEERGFAIESLPFEPYP